MSGMSVYADDARTLVATRYPGYSLGVHLLQTLKPGKLRKLGVLA